MNAGFINTSFADDMNAWRTFDPRLDPLVEGKAELLKVQQEVHTYGLANQIEFDSGKETMHYLHAQNGFSFGDDQTFRILGCYFDPKLLMHEAVKIIAVEAGWRLRSLLRSQRYFSVPSLVHLYKSLVLSYLESFTAAIYHTADSVIERIDRIQDRLLVRCRLIALEAFSRFNLAPLPTRRDIAMLGILHKVVLGVAPPGISSIFPKGPIAFPLAYPLRMVLI